MLRPMTAKILLLGLAALPAWAGEGGGTELAPGIREHRMGTIVVRAPAGTAVKVEQRRHAFWFGTAISRKMFLDEFGADPADRQRYQEVLLANFNSAVHENALKWYCVEKERGKFRWDLAEETTRWCLERGLMVRGHCVYWAVPRYVQDWIKGLDDEALRVAMRERCRQVMTRFKETIPEYDVNNEMLHGKFYADRLGGDIRAQMFRWCREDAPDAVLYVNDYDILTGGYKNYIKQIKALQAQGAPVGGIGVQGHYKGRVNGTKLKEALDALGELGLPIKVTEYDCAVKDEQVKRESLVTLYETCFAHPAVEGILMWGFWEGRHWRKQAALWKQDWTPTPAAQAYRELVYDRWWTRWEGTTGDDGTVTVPAFFGTHVVTVGGETREVVLAKADGTVTVAGAK